MSFKSLNRASRGYLKRGLKKMLNLSSRGYLRKEDDGFIPDNFVGSGSGVAGGGGISLRRDYTASNNLAILLCVESSL